MQQWQHMWLEIRRWTDYKVVTSRSGFLIRFELTVGDRVLDIGENELLSTLRPHVVV